MGGCVLKLLLLLTGDKAATVWLAEMDVLNWIKPHHGGELHMIATKGTNVME